MMATDSQQSREDGEISDDGEIIDLTLDGSDGMAPRKVIPSLLDEFPSSSSRSRQIQRQRSNSRQRAQTPSSRNWYRNDYGPDGNRRHRLPSTNRHSNKRTVLPPRRAKLREYPPNNSNDRRRVQRTSAHSNVYGTAVRRKRRDKGSISSESKNSVDDVNDYDELLAQYKTIQAKLDLIKKEEEQTGQILGTNVQNEDVHETNTEENTQAQQNDEDEDEYDELKLRLVALASAAKTQIKLSTEELERKQRTAQNVNKDVDASSGSRSSRRRRASRNRSRDSPAVGRGQRERAQERRRQESNEILLLDDPNEQYERFMQLIGYTNRTPSGFTKPNHPPMTDNYDQVEMEIDSDPEPLQVEEFFPSPQFLFDAPPPPPPPLPMGSPPSSPPPPPPDPPSLEALVTVAQEEEEDEAMLREQLLKAMKVKQTSQEQQNNGTESPIEPRPAATATATTTTTKNSNRKPNWPVLIPRHPTVVIPLGDDSEDSAEEDGTAPRMSAGLLGGLDSFLKSARESVEKKQTAETVSGAKKLEEKENSGESNAGKAEDGIVLNKRLEQKFVKERAELMDKKQELSIMVGHIKKRKVMLRTTEERVEMLRQQLIAAEKLVNANKQYIHKLERQALEFKQATDKKSKVVKDLQSKLSEAGVKIPPPDVSGAKKAGDKRSAEKTTPSKDVKKPKLQAKPKKSSGVEQKPKLKLTAREKEKLRLQKLEREFAEKIRKLKEAQKVKTRKKSVSQKAHEQVRRSLSQDLNVTLQPATAEKIVVDVNIDSDFADLPKRHSFIDENPHMVPEFVEESKMCKSEAKKTESAIIKLPELNVRNNIETLLKERTLLVLSPKDCVNTVCSTDKSALEISNSVIDSLFGESRAAAQDSEFHKYNSSLNHFKAYRFSQHYRGKISSRTYANKINPKQLLCRFDLMGSCNDDKCPWQHNAGMKMKDLDVLVDFLSYDPAAIDVHTDSEEQMEKSLVDYAEQFYQVYKSSKSLDFMCEKLAKKVNGHSGHVYPYNMFTDARRWRPVSKAVDTQPAVVPEYVASYSEEVNDADDGGPHSDVRYFMLSNNHADELEATLKMNPTDIDTWIKLARRRRGAQRNESVGTDVALNVLARGLESNQSCPDLWLEYLNVYSQKRNTTDYADMCAHAARLAPSYEIYHKCLSAAPTFLQKTDICQQLINCAVLSEVLDPAMKSKQLLESILIQAWLNVHGGQYRTAVQYLGKSLKSDWFSNLCVKDQCTAWLCYISLLEFHCLPDSILSEDSQSFCRLVKEEEVTLDWTSGKKRHLPVDSILKHFQSALNSCSQLDKDAEAITRSCLALYSNLVLFQIQVCKRFEVAAEIYRKLLKASPSLGEVWLLLAKLHEQSNNIEAARKVYSEGISAAPSYIPLLNAAATFENSQENSDRALEILESCVIGLFIVDRSDSTVCDPNLLYCKVLDLPLPLNYTAPSFKNDVSPDMLSSHAVYLWSNYCMLLDIQGYHDQITEVYETALCTLKSTQHVKLMWLRYLEYMKDELSFSEDKNQQFALLYKLVRRCLASMPSKCAAVTNSNLQCVDYSFHNRVLSMFLTSIPEEHHTTVYKKFISWMPDNYRLVLRACEHALKMEDLHVAKYLCCCAIYDKPASVNLWKMVIAINLQLKETLEVRKLFWKAVQTLPFSAAIWKDMLLFELCHGSQETLNAVTAHYTKLRLNFNDFIAAVVPSKS